MILGDGEEEGSRDALDESINMSSTDSVLDHTVISSSSPRYCTFLLYNSNAASDAYPKPPKFIFPVVVKKTWLSGELGFRLSRVVLSPSIYNRISDERQLCFGTVSARWCHSLSAMEDIPVTVYA